MQLTTKPRHKTGYPFDGGRRTFSRCHGDVRVAKGRGRQVPLDTEKLAPSKSLVFRGQMAPPIAWEWRVAEGPLMYFGVSGAACHIQLTQLKKRNHGTNPWKFNP